ncbi:uncharacterized protein EAF02_011114 [Botrytis sinoallii]|uniref:uncharacterized protein n=1 Tax=Botrytis sinoallii TaxID=1463999 RepID=UPI0019019E33|nr:uncharacterized protein EAF02_011114 [Botrytis sinoallii]KAF7858790.1 hypothetical protein EAF02_011114 [Botrytis sinoallii]
MSAKRYGPKYPQPPKGFKIPRPIPQVEPIHDGKGGKGQSVWEVLYNAEREKDARIDCFDQTSKEDIPSSVLYLGSKARTRVKTANVQLSREKICCGSDHVGSCMVNFEPHGCAAEECRDY